MIEGTYKGKPADMETLSVSVAELAAFLSIDRRQVYDLVPKGLPRLADGKFNLRDAVNWYLWEHRKCMSPAERIQDLQWQLEERDDDHRAALAALDAENRRLRRELSKGCRKATKQTGGTSTRGK